MTPVTRLSSLLVFLTFVAGLIPALHAQDDLVVAGTYNVYLMYDTVDDPDVNDQDFDPKPAESLDALAAVIRGLNADLLGLQEVENRNVLETFNRERLEGMGYHVAMHPEEPGMFNVALLSRFPVKRAQRFGHYNDGVQSSYRIMRHRMVYFEVEAPGPDGGIEPLHVFVLHLKAMGDERSRAMRMDMVRDLGEWIQGPLELDPAEDPILLVGDMNDRPGSAPLEHLLSLGFVDLTALGGTPTPTMSSRQPNSQIDFVLASQGILPRFVANTAKVGSVPTLEAIKGASDHLPVVAAFLASGVEENDLTEASRERIAQLRAMPHPLALMQVRDAEQVAEAVASGRPMTIAEIRAEALAAISRGETPPVRIAVGMVQSEGENIVRGRVQLAFADLTGGIIIDRQGRGDMFPTMPVPGQVVRITGRASQFRDVMQFTPIQPVEILGDALFPVEVPVLGAREFTARAQSYQGARVIVEARAIERQNLGSGVKFTLAPTERRTVDPAAAFELWVPAVAFSPEFQAGDHLRIYGIVSSYRGVPQLQVTQPADVSVLGE